MSGRDQNRTVYSTDTGRMCPECGSPAGKCTCKNKVKTSAATVRQDGIVRLRIERKGRGGKTVTLVEGLPQQSDLLKSTIGELKKACGSGGALKNGVLEIQGDVRSMAAKILEGKGYRVKIAGG